MKRTIVFVVMFVLAVLMVSANGKQEKAAGNQGSTEKKETSLRIKCVSWIAKKGFVTQAVNDLVEEGDLVFAYRDPCHYAEVPPIHLHHAARPMEVVTPPPRASIPRRPHCRA